MPYTDAVVKESLRLLGPAGSLLRASPEDFDLDGKGTIIPKWVLQGDWSCTCEACRESPAISV